MAQDLGVPHLSYEQLRTKATGFLNQHHPSGLIPVPIEEIVELRLRLDVIPTPGLLTNFDVDAYITSDMECIYIDEFIYKSRPSRYRFSLAHEVAHAVLPYPHRRLSRAIPRSGRHDHRGACRAPGSVLRRVSPCDGRHTGKRSK